MGKDASGSGADDRKLWWQLAAVCLGFLMISLSSTIVNVALPSIRVGLQFSASSLVWVVSGYLACFGGFLLLAGRLGDLFGNRNVFLLGVLLFSGASLGCGLADSRELLVAMRCVQGLAGAIVSAVALSLIYNLFSDSSKRTRALGVCAFVGACGGSLGLLLGGALTSILGWRWIFFANVPVGLVVWVLCSALIPRVRIDYRGRSLDVPGALLGTAASLMALYAIVNGTRVGWGSPQTLSLLVIAMMLLALFMMIEARAPVPLMPLELFRIRNVAVANILSALFAGAVFGWSFLTTLYLQTVLHFGPFEVGVTFLPANVLTALMSLTVTPWLVGRLGIRTPLVSGLLIASAGLVWLGSVPVKGSVWGDVIPAIVLLGMGTGMAYNPLFVGALNGVGPSNSGAASGILNTAFALGGALGVSVLASIAAASRNHVVGGYRAGFNSGAVLVAVAALIAGCFLRSDEMPRGCSAAKEAA